MPTIIYLLFTSLPRKLALWHERRKFPSGLPSVLFPSWSKEDKNPPHHRRCFAFCKEKYKDQEGMTFFTDTFYSSPSFPWHFCQTLSSHPFGFLAGGMHRGITYDRFGWQWVTLQNLLIEIFIQHILPALHMMTNVITEPKAMKRWGRFKLDIVSNCGTYNKKRQAGTRII